MMMRGPEIRCVFTYSYRAAAPQNPDEGGFSLNLFDSDVLDFSVYSTAGEQLVRHRFQVQQNTAGTVLRIIEWSRWWLDRMPKHMSEGETAAQSHMVMGFAGTSMFCLDDLETILRAPFGSQRGHFSRQLLGLLEDMAAVLASQGITFTPDSFSWDGQRVRPISTEQARSRGQTGRNQAI